MAQSYTKFLLPGASVVMTSGLVVTLILAQSSLRASAQPGSSQVSSTAFTLEQIAVYQAFLSDYRRGDNRKTINVAEVTETLQPDEGDYSGCMKGFPKSTPAKGARRLTLDFAEQNHLLIVDPKVHKVEDPEDVMRTGQSVESAVESGFKSGLLTLSEIIFDTNRKRAALHYSFICGRLCAHFETVVYEKRHGIWRPSKNSCGYGVS